MTSSSPRLATKRTRRSSRRPLLEPMEDRVVLTASPHQAAVTQLYQDLLHRLPDAGGLDYWTNQLGQGADTTAVATALTHSTEFHRGEVDGVYQRLLNRAADEGGRAFFASALDGGQTVQQVEAAVAASPEYAQSHPGASGFLDALFNGADHLRALADGAYQQVLRRAGDAAGLDYWAGRMSAGTSLDDVMASLAASAEKAAMTPPTSTVLGTFANSSALPSGGPGALETTLAGSVHQALGLSQSAPGGSAGPQSVTLKSGLPAVFQAFGPERLVDTRNTVVGQYGGPAFAVNSTRTINVAPYNLADPSIPSAAIGDQAPTSNLPGKVVAVSVILFIVGAPQAEYFTAYATGTSPAPTGTATVFADHAGQTIAASAIVPVNAAGNINVYSSGGGNLVIDVTGYFLNTLDGSDYLPITGNVPGGAADSTVTGVVVGSNDSTTNRANGVTGVITSTSPGNSAAAVRGINNGTGSVGYGVWGSQAGSGIAVYGSSGTGGNGVWGEAVGSGVGVTGIAGASGTGVYALAGAGGTGVSANGGTYGVQATGDVGVSATGTTTGLIANGGASYGIQTYGGTGIYAKGSGYGVLGYAENSSPATTIYGVQGYLSGTTSIFNNSAGVLGIGPGGDSAGYSGYSAGVLGRAGTGGIPVIGIGDFEGVRGINTAGNSSTVNTFGSLGYSDSTAGFFSGNTVATGTKSFVDPSPTDPTKVIKYVTLEGPEVGTYFRGTGHFTNGKAILDVPEIFRSETEPNGLSIQVTPVGGIANVGVESIDLNHIVVLGSRDLDFFYTVNGIRLGYKDFQPIQAQDREFLPQGPNATMPTSLNAVQKARLIATGVYNADGSVNLTTAHKMGWDALWPANGATAAK